MIIKIKVNKNYANFKFGPKTWATTIPDEWFKQYDLSLSTYCVDDPFCFDILGLS
jgi:hypothetical protein